MSQPRIPSLAPDPSSSSSSGSSEKTGQKQLQTSQGSERSKTAKPLPEKSMASQEDPAQLRMVQTSESEYVEVDEREPDEVPETSYVELPDFDATAGEPPALEDYKLEQHADGVEVERLLEKKVLLPLDRLANSTRQRLEVEAESMDQEIKIGGKGIVAGCLGHVIGR